MGKTGRLGAKLRRMEEDSLHRTEERRREEAEKARQQADAEAEERRKAEAARMEAMVQEFLTFHGLQLCQGHGICYESRTGYCHLVSSAAFEQDIGERVIGYIRHRCKRKRIQCRWPCKIKELGQHVSRLLDGRASSDATESWCFVGTRKKLLYFCGCKNMQPMLKGSFERHIHAEGNKCKCRWSLWGKSDTEKLVMEATAVACCRVRCVKATCGLWIIRDRIEPDMSKLSKIIQKLIARRVDRGGKKSGSGDTSTLIASSEPSVISGKVDEEENRSDAQPAAEAKEIAADSEAPAESESTSTATSTMNSNIAKSTKPVVLLLGYTFRQETNDNGPTYTELLEEARYFYGKDNTQLPGAIRDKARIARLRDRGFDCFCVSKSNKDENDESMHYYGDFCDRKFVQKLREKMRKYGKPHPVQICVDWVYCPIGWDTTQYLKPQFFTKTLPEIASLLSSDTIEIDAKNRRITRKRKRDENKIPSGVIFLPFTLGVVAELFKALDLVEESYTISYLDREQLMVEHPMYAATASIPDNEMKLLNKKPRPEDGYADDLFKNIDVGASSNVNARLFKGYVQSNCTEQTRMIKLTLKLKERV